MLVCRLTATELLGRAVGGLRLGGRRLQAVLLRTDCIRHAFQTPQERLLEAVLQRDWGRAARLLRRHSARRRLQLAAVHQCRPAAGASLFLNSSLAGREIGSGFYSPITLLGALVCVAEGEEEALPLAQQLLECGAPPDGLRWYDGSGRHTPLSKALQRRWYRLAALLLQHGANPNVLPRTDYLGSTRFSSEQVAWLIDATAGTQRAAAVCHSYTVAHVVRECMLDCLRLHFSRHIAKQRKQRHIQQLVAAAEQLVLRLGAAGAPPAQRDDLQLPLCFSSGEWQQLMAAATTRLVWSPATHAYFPTGARAAARQWLLLASTRSLPGGTQLDAHLTHRVVQLIMAG